MASRRGAYEALIRDGAVAQDTMAKAELSGTVTSFRQSKFKQDTYQTIVTIATKDHGAKLIGARVVWRRKDGLQILGRIVASHGSKGAVRVRWNRGFPPQALGSQVKILR